MDKPIREQLNDLAEEKYRVFSTSLTPGKENILGVRLPLLKKVALKLVKEDWRAYLVKAEDNTMEEVMLQGMVIGNLRIEIEEVLKLTSELVPKIDCWPVCDSFCSCLKIAKEYKSQVWEFLQPYLMSDKEFEIRFGVVMILNYFVLPEYASIAFKQFDQIKHEGYYVKMAVAWAISIYYVKLPEVTMEYLKNNNLDDVTFNKALQKIIESRRTTPVMKDLIRSMKRKVKNPDYFL